MMRNLKNDYGIRNNSTNNSTNNSINSSRNINNLINDLEPNNSIQRQLFALNSMSTNELKLKWLELYKAPALNFKKGFLIKSIAYKIQLLACLSNVSQEELSLSLNIAKDKLKISGKGSLLNRQVNLIPPAGSIIKTFHKGNEYIVKVIDNSGNNAKFEYDCRIYKSLSAIATDITGTRWNGYTFFKLKKTIKSIREVKINRIDKMDKIAKTDKASNKFHSKINNNE